MIVIKKTTGDLLIDTGMQYLILTTLVKENFTVKTNNFKFQLI